MIATETAKTVLLILFGLSILWIVVIIVKNDMQTIVRALVVAAVVGLALYIVNMPKIARHDKVSFAILRDELFPVKKQAYPFTVQDERFQGKVVKTFVFQDPGPPLSLVMVNGGKFMAIKDVRPVNNVLEFLGLPPISAGVEELASITGKTLDADKYRWDDYERGVLLLERSICRDMTSASSFPCISRITVTPR
jgi:hypothetical protein